MGTLNDTKLSLEIVEKFWAKVDRAPGFGPDGNCWRWTGHMAGKYPKFPWAGKMVPAGRVALWIAQGREPTGQVGHRCGKTLCVNPAHLVEGATGLYAQERRPAQPLPALDLIAMLRPADVATYASKHTNALTEVTTASLLVELGRRVRQPESGSKLAEEINAMIKAGPAGGGTGQAYADNNLFLRLRCDVPVSGEGADDPFVTYSGPILMSWQDDKGDEHLLKLGQLRFTVIARVENLVDRWVELEGALLDVYHQILKHPIDRKSIDWAERVHNCEAVDESPSSLLVIEELELEPAVEAAPLTPWVVDTLIERFDHLGRVMVACCDGPAGGAEQNSDSQVFSRQHAQWASAGLTEVPGTSFFIADMGNRNPPMPQLPSIAAMLTAEQMTALELDDVAN